MKKENQSIPEEKKYRLIGRGRKSAEEAVPPADADAAAQPGEFLQSGLIPEADTAPPELPEKTRAELRAEARAAKAQAKQEAKDAAKKKRKKKKRRKARKQAEAQAQQAAAAPPKKKKKGTASTIILLIILFLGAGIMAYPTVSDWWNSYHQARDIVNYTNIVENTDAETMEKMLEAAEAYNERLLSKGNRYTLSDEELEEYESLLDLTGSGAMGFIYIKSIGVYLPIYHGTSEEVLQIAVGHIEGSSLPVGGMNTHSVLSGHRGLPSAKLFSDLDKLSEGDVFTITVLNRVITYEVDQIRIVLPADVSELNIVSGEDYCTLVTCTPYGVNTHRMLVRGHRIPNAEGDIVVVAGAIRIPNYIVIPAVGIPLLFVFLAIMLLYYRRRRPQYTEAELIKQYVALNDQNEREAQKIKES